MRSTNEWLGWAESEDRRSDVLSETEIVRFQMMGENPQLEDFVLAAMEPEESEFKGEQR